ncbi:HlyD family efflux transporter periplasmic adaptor subunit [Limnochorda pilosa]|uniref:RND related barrel-sandwich hybrid domain-containing protein n=1 Tax=Limnochorda pilosa TaxID=1555112 RepID=A0A0K2SMZ6_LIMPI|nr:HlyD family efflux transporter periplasmic adaptor subunit [Limnochorda pilosa]BAS28377.1 hypothetical protein LIP_2547 [Limnochorda pilosa]
MRRSWARLAVVLGAAALLLAFLVWTGRAGVRWAREALVRSVPAEKGAVEQRVGVDAWVLRREWVLRSPASGYLVPLARPGEHVPRSTVLAEVVDRIERAGLGQELEQIRAGIDRARRDLESLGREEAALSAEIQQQEESLGNQIAFALSFDREEELKALLDLREQIRAEQGERRAELEARRAQAEADRERLLERRAQVEARLASATDVIRAPEAGRFELRVDGLEEILTPEQVLDLAPGYLRGLRVQERSAATGDRVVAGQPVARLVDPQRVHVYVFLPSGHGLQVGRKLLFQAEGAERVAAAVREVRFFGDESGVLLELDAVPDALLDRRRTRGALILDRHEGVVVPTSALIRRGEATGVLVEAEGGRLFTGVQVKGHDAAWAAVSGVAEGSRVVVNPGLLGEEAAGAAPAGER